MRSSLLLFLYVICLLTSSEAFAETTTGKNLKFAAVLGLTGGASTHSNSIKNGIELATEKLKAQGWKVDFRIEDDQTVPAKSVSSFRSLMARDYQFFIGPTWSFQAKAVKPLLDHDKALAILPASSSAINGGAHENLFNLCPRRDRQGPVLAKWLKSEEPINALILTQTSDWGELHRRIFEDAIKQSGSKVVAQEQIDYGVDKATLSSIITRVAKKDIDYIFTTGAAADVANVLLVRNRLQLDAGIVSTNDLRDALEQKLISKEDLHAKDRVLHLPSNKEFASIFEPKFSRPPLLYADRGYDAVMLLAEALDKTDGSFEAVKQYLSESADFQGITGRIRFDKSGDLQDGRYFLSLANSKFFS